MLPQYFLGDFTSFFPLPVSTIKIFRPRVQRRETYYTFFLGEGGGKGWLGGLDKKIRISRWQICVRLQILYHYFGFTEVNYVHLLFIIIETQKVLCSICKFF
jgi:hypothetical protein